MLLPAFILGCCASLFPCPFDGLIVLHIYSKFSLFTAVFITLWNTQAYTMYFRFFPRITNLFQRCLVTLMILQIKSWVVGMFIDFALLVLGLPQSQNKKTYVYILILVYIHIYKYFCMSPSVFILSQHELRLVAQTLVLYHMDHSGFAFLWTPTPTVKNLFLTICN